MRAIGALARRGRRILCDEGLASLVRQAFAFLLRKLFQYERYYLYRQPTESLRLFDETRLLPEVPGIIFKVIATTQEADEVESAGLPLRSYALNVDERLRNGAVAFCTYAGKDMANISWLAFSDEAQKSLDEVPCRVDFSHGEAYRGGIWTSPKYRRVGFSMYSLFKKLEYMKERGVVASRVAIPEGNIASQRGHARFAPMRYGRGRLIRFLWWKRWDEKPL